MQDRAIGADNIVLKPFRDGELERRVDDTIPRRPQLGQRHISGGLLKT